MKSIVVFRGIERILLVLSGCFVTYLGFYLFRLGIDKGDVQFTFESMTLTGTGPGLLFMAAGVVLLIYCVKTQATFQERKANGDESLSVLGEPEDESPTPGAKNPPFPKSGS